MCILPPGGRAGHAAAVVAAASTPHTNQGGAPGASAAVHIAGVRIPLGDNQLLKAASNLGVFHVSIIVLIGTFSVKHFFQWVENEKRTKLFAESTSLFCNQLRKE